MLRNKSVGELFGIMLVAGVVLVVAPGIMKEWTIMQAEQQGAACSHQTTSTASLLSVEEPSSTASSEKNPPHGCLMPALVTLCSSNKNEQHQYGDCVKKVLETGWFLTATKYKPSNNEISFRELIKKQSPPIKVSIGAGGNGISSDGFVLSDRPQLDLFLPQSWASAFSSQGGIDVFFAEHVLEHFAPTQVQKVAALSFLYLKPGGRFRIAVPDAYFQDEKFSLYVRAGSTPSGHGQNHMLSWSHETMAPIFSQQGFDIKLLEWFDIHGRFNSSWPPFDTQYGLVRRSIRFDDRNNGTAAFQAHHKTISYQHYIQSEGFKFPSLILDAIKPHDCPVWTTTTV